MKNYIIIVIALFLLGTGASLVAIPMDLNPVEKKAQGPKLTESGRLAVDPRNAHQGAGDSSSAQESDAARGDTLAVSSDEDSDEGKTDKEAASGRSSESSAGQDLPLLGTPWSKALQRMQKEEAEWQSIHPDMKGRVSSTEVDNSLLRAESVFRVLQNQADLEEATKKIKFSADQYILANQAYLRGENNKVMFYKQAAETAKRSASQSVVAEEYSLIALDSGERDIRLRYTNAARAAKHSTQQFEKAALYAQQIAEEESLHPGSAVAVRLKQALAKASSAAELYLQAGQAYPQNSEEAKSLQAAAKQDQDKAKGYFEEALRLKGVVEVVVDDKELSFSKLKFAEPQSASSASNSNQNTLEASLAYAKSEVAKQKRITQSSMESQERFNLATQYYQLAVDDGAEAKHQATENVKLAELYNHASSQSQRAGDYFSNSAKKLASGQQIETPFYEAAQFAVKSAAAFRDTALHWLNVKSASESGDAQGAELGSQLCEDSKTAAEHYAQAAELRKEKNPSQASMLQQAAEALLKKIQDCREVITKAQEAKAKREVFLQQGREADLEAKNEIGGTCRAITRKLQLMSEHLKHAAKAYLDGNNEAVIKYEGMAAALNGHIIHLEVDLESLLREWQEWKENGSNPYCVERNLIPGPSMMSDKLTALEQHIWKNKFTGPLVLIEKYSNSSETNSKEVRMAADHLNIKLNEGSEIGSLEEYIQEHVPGKVIKVQKSGVIRPLYSLYFKPDEETSSPWLSGMKKMKQAVQDSGLTLTCHAEPFIKVELDSTSALKLVATGPEESTASPQLQNPLWNLHGPFGINPPANFWSGTDHADSKSIPLEKGAPSLIAILDTGIALDEDGKSHPALQDSILSHQDSTTGETVYGYNALDDNGWPEDSDRNAHGTHIAGIIGAKSQLINKVLALVQEAPPVYEELNIEPTATHRGVASIGNMTKLFICKWLRDNEDGGLLSHLNKCIIYARQVAQARVLNCSFGFTRAELQYLGTEDELNELGDILSNHDRDTFPQDALIVSSAGNQKSDEDELDNDKLTGDLVRYPAAFNLPNLITVAATDQSGSLALWSHYGKKSVHIAAPGEDIISTSNSSIYPYQMLSGTSFASSHITAALALIMKKFPVCEDGIPLIINQLLSTADLLTPIADQGIKSGRLNLARALGEYTNQQPALEEQDDLVPDSALDTTSQLDDFALKADK